MEQEIKALETLYAGEKFRSKLEAQWAVFFDACGVEWKYEPEGYNLGDGVWYLPDFKLEHSDGIMNYITFVEVKGKVRRGDMEKIERFSKAVGQLCEEDAYAQYVVVGDIPKGETLDEISANIYKREPPYYGFCCDEKNRKIGTMYPGIYHTTSASVDNDYGRYAPILSTEFNSANKNRFHVGDISELKYANASATVEAFAAARYFKFDRGGWKNRQTPISVPDTDDSWRRRWYSTQQGKREKQLIQRRRDLYVDGYKGIRFDSELEMQWAMVFDYLHVEWEYHPEQLERWDFRYTPTFWLPDIGLYAEVEPSNEQLEEDSEKLTWMVDYAGPCADGIIVLGQLPLKKAQRADNYGGYYTPMFSIIYHADNALGGTFGGFIPTKDGVGFLYGDQIEREARIFYTTSKPVQFMDFNSAPAMPNNVSTETAYVYVWPFEDFQSAMVSACWY